MPSDRLIEEKFEEVTGVIGGSLASCFDGNLALISSIDMNEDNEVIDNRQIIDRY